MLFQDEHIPMIRSGSKTATRRDWSKNYAGPNVGSVVAATTKLFVPNEEADCFIRITDRYRQKLGHMSSKDLDAEGGYTRGEFYELWADLHGEFDVMLEVDVVEFDYIGRTPGGVQD